MKQKWNQFKERQVRVHELDDRLLLLNLYLTQGLTLLAALIWIWLQGRNPFALLVLPEGWQWLWWGAGLAVAVVLIDIAVSQFVPEEMTDDGGMNEKLFGKRPVWHIVVICLIVGICEELLFRGRYSMLLARTGPVFCSPRSMSAICAIGCRH